MHLHSLYGKSSRRLDSMVASLGVIDRQLTVSQREFSERVASRCVAIGTMMGLKDDRLVELELAARLHRVGEAALAEELRTRSVLDLTGPEQQAYLLYPLISAQCIGPHAGRVSEIVRQHRQYIGLFKESQIPMPSRILCVSVEYEEMVRHRGGHTDALHTIQKHMYKNVAGRYDQEVLRAFMLTIRENSDCH